MTDFSPRDFVSNAALVRGASAVLIESFIASHRDAWNRHTAMAMASDSLRRELTSSWLAIEAAAEAHRAAIDRLADASAGPSAGPSAGGSDETMTEMQTMLTTVEASEILGLTTRRIRQLAASGFLLGRMVAGRWMIDPRSVETRRTA